MMEKMELGTRLERMECITRICGRRKVHTMRLAGTDECGGSIGKPITEDNISSCCWMANTKEVRICRKEDDPVGHER